MKKLMMAGLLGLCLAGMTAQAADPDYVWREQLRALVTTNAGTALAVTNVEVATTVDALDSVTPAFKDAWTNATAAVTVTGGDAVGTNATTTDSALFVTNASVGGGMDVGTNITSIVNNLVLTNVLVTIETGTGYDSTGAAVTNAAGDIMALATNFSLTLQYGSALASATLETGTLTPTISLERGTALTGVTLETGAITATSTLTPETGEFVSGITSNVVTPVNSISFETDTFVTP